jgi:hypothetical protein
MVESRRDPVDDFRIRLGESTPITPETIVNVKSIVALLGYRPLSLVDVSILQKVVYIECREELEQQLCNHICESRCCPFQPPIWSLMVTRRRSNDVPWSSSMRVVIEDLFPPCKRPETDAESDIESASNIISAAAL